MLYIVKRYAGVILLSVAIIIGLIYFSINRTSLSEEATDSTEHADDIVTLEETSAEEITSEDEVSAIESTAVLIVDVKGAIVSPGIYEMTEGDRINDVIQLAGGFTKRANESEVNLAQKLQDEMVIVVPKEGEELDQVTLATRSPNETEEVVGDKINLNQATQAELETLNGIGPSKAQAIIDYREEHGTFQTIEDVLEVSGIGEKTLEAFKDDLIVP